MSFTAETTFYFSGSGDDESNVELNVILLPESQGLEARITVDNDTNDDAPTRYYRFEPEPMRRFARALLLLCEIHEEEIEEIAEEIRELRALGKLSAKPA